MPYLYSLAADVYWKDYTLMRGLVMDFPNDRKVLSINDQYLLGPSLLVNPVTIYGARSRKVYLPAGQGWFDLYTGKFYNGGQEINALSDYQRMPVFVKQGSILPYVPALQYTLEKRADTIHLFVYTGKNARFDLYEDDGISTNYEKGEKRVIPIIYDERSKTLTIENSNGNIRKTIQHIFLVTSVSPGKAEHLQFERYDKAIHYSGERISIQLMDKKEK